MTRTGQPLDVLLLEGHYRQALACMRTYGRMGLRVGVVVSESEAWQASNLRSRWCSMSATVPDLESRSEAFADALLALLDRHAVGMVLPAHDGSIEVLRARRAEFERRAGLPLASEAALAVAVSKPRTLALGAELGIAIPRSVAVTDLPDVPEALHELGCPVVIKPVQSWVERGSTGTRLMTVTARSVSEAKERFSRMLEAGGQAVIQEWLPGRREAVSLFYARDRFWARFAQTSYREFPPLGGASVLCESIPLLPELTQSAERLVRAMDLEGCSMVEFRRDRKGRPVLMEVNPRMAGSVALAISAGVNLPQLVYDWAMGAPLQEVTQYRVGRRLRWIEADLRNLECAFRFQGHPDVAPAGHALATFLSDFVRRPSALNVSDRADIGPELAQGRKILRQYWHKARKHAAARRVARKESAT